MKKMILFFIFFHSLVFGKTLISKNSHLLCVSYDSKYIVYLKLLSSEPDEYVFGYVYIYNTETGENSALNKEKYILNFLKIAYLPNNFYLSDGEILYRYSFANAKKTLVYRTKSNEIINNFAVSHDKSTIAINVKLGNKIDEQKILLINLKINEINTLYEVTDTSIGEEIKNEIFWSENDNLLFVKNIHGKLISIDIVTKKILPIDDNVLRLYLVDRCNLYYTKHNDNNIILYQYDYKKNSYFDIMQSKDEDMKIYFIGKLNNDLAISLYGNILVYKGNSVIENIAEDDKGDYIFINTKFAIQQREKDLYIYPMEFSH